MYMDEYGGERYEVMTHVVNVVSDNMNLHVGGKQMHVC
jgi:hypothetical protein